MKQLSDKELAVILEAASYMTLRQHEDTCAINIAYYLWEIYNNHKTKEREKAVKSTKQLLFKH